MGDEGGKAAMRGDEVIITLQDGEKKEMHFRVGKNQTLGQSMLAYCYHYELQFPAMRFLFDGKSVKQYQTPTDIGIDDYGAIDVFYEQLGGGGGGF